MHLSSDSPSLIALLQPGLRLQKRYRIIQFLGNGGMGCVFEVIDEAQPETPAKILKVLHDPKLPGGTPPSPKMLEYFQQEARVLKNLQCPGIPQVFPEDNYFCETFSCNAQPNQTFMIHGLVMEKVIGENLAHWLQNPHNRLSEDQAIQWLEQIIHTLVYLHNNGVIHRDIKPSNIMLRPSGELVLIDFGIVREMTETYYAKQRLDLTGTRILTLPYAAPEQMRGRAVPQSDFYALGQTFIQLLAQSAVPEHQTLNDEQTQCWQTVPIQASPPLSQLLKWMTQLDEKKRPKSAVALARSLARIKRDRDPTQRRRELPWALAWSIVATTITLGIRSLGWLQPLELVAFDQFMRLRPIEPPDPRIAIITIDDADRAWQREQEMLSLPGVSLSDTALILLLEKLNQQQVSVIGLDLYRDFSTKEESPQLIEQLGQDHLITLCKVLGGEDESSIPPSNDVSLVGFNDLLPDPDGIIRRQSLSMNAPPESRCTDADWSFSTLIALRYWYDSGLKATPSLKETTVGGHTFQHMQLPFGGYQRLPNHWGEQLVLNYRSVKEPLAVAAHLSLREFLEGNIPKTWGMNQIVLIGVIDPTSDDYHKTPIGRLPGVIIHAHMVSHLLSTVSNERPSIWVWSGQIETVWIMLWVSLGVMLMRLRQCSKSYLLINFGIGSALIIICLTVFLLMAGWLPLVPVLFAMTLGNLLLESHRLIAVHCLHPFTIPKSSLPHEK